jgi:hypothetical protein
MNADAMRADLVQRINNAVNDLKNEWMASGNPSDTFTIEAVETPTGVSVNLFVKVSMVIDKADKDTPLSKKKINP